MGEPMTKILVVDNDKSIRRLCYEELTDLGYEVILGADYSTVLECIEEEKPDLVILDIRMGRLNGLDLLQDIRNNHYNLPVILYTAYPSYKYDIRSIAADYYVIKTSNLDILKLKIQMALEGDEILRIHLPDKSSIAVSGLY